MKKIISVFLTALLLTFSFSLSASANSAQTWWEGTDASGVITTDENCPLIVKNEVLTFNIDSFPLSYYRSAEAFMKYSASVTAQYTFYNPADYSVTAKLLFPFGEKPMYLYNYFNESTQEYSDADDTEKYEITQNGVPVDKKLRYTLNRGNFDINKDLQRIKEGFTKDSFYYPEMPVKKCTFLASSIDPENDNAANAGYDLPEFDGKTKYYFVQQSGFQKLKNGENRHSTWVENGDEFTVYVIGDTSVKFPEWTVFKNSGRKDNEIIDGAITLISEENITFSDLVFSQYDESYGIQRHDWYNAVVEIMNINEDESGAVTGGEGLLFIKDDLLRWYEYEITVDAKSEVINCVNAPVYPEIDSNYSPSVYDYLYLLSPASTWADFGSLDIIVNTPYFITDSGNFSFTETDFGYELKLDKLPEEELSFRMSTVENPIKPAKHITDIIPVEILIMLSTIAAAVAVIISIITLIRKKYLKEHKT